MGFEDVQAAKLMGLGVDEELDGFGAVVVGAVRDPESSAAYPRAEVLCRLDVHTGDPANAFAGQWTTSGGGSGTMIGALN